MPLITLVAMSLVFQSEVMPPLAVVSPPGAKTSMHEPMFEYDARLSVFVVAPTVIADAASAGLVVHASLLLLPAATTYVTPDATDALTASSMLDTTTLVPRLMFATAGLIACSVTHSMPAITWSDDPPPEQSSTRTDTMVTPFATP